FAGATEPSFLCHQLVKSVPLLLIVPEQERFPLLLVMVQPVAAEPPAMFTSTEPSPCRFSPVFVAAIVPSSAKVRSSAETVIVSMLETPVKSPLVETFRPPFDANWN